MCIQQKLGKNLELPGLCRGWGGGGGWLGGWWSFGWDVVIRFHSRPALRFELGMYLYAHSV